MQEKEMIAYVNGQYIPQSEAKVSIFDHGFLWGDGVYDAMVTLNGYLFKLDKRIDRLFRSIHSFDINMPLSKDECKEIIINVVRENRAKEQYVKIIVTSGVGPLPVMDRSNCKTSVVVFSRPLFYLVSREKESEKGIKTIIANTRRIPAQCLDPKAKNLNYANFVLAEHEARRVGVDMAIMLDIHGFVSEAPGYNIFVVRQGKLYTPPEKDNILVGITRETILEIAEQAGIEAIEASLIPNDIFNADEVFLCNGMTGTAGVVEVDGRIISNGKPGSITKRLSKLYLEMKAAGQHGTPFLTN
jgi:branched-chain amino acid aminotransferase